MRSGRSMKRDDAFWARLKRLELFTHNDSDRVGA